MSVRVSTPYSSSLDPFSLESTSSLLLFKSASNSNSLSPSHCSPPTLLSSEWRFAKVTSARAAGGVIKRSNMLPNMSGENRSIVNSCIWYGKMGGRGKKNFNLVKNIQSKVDDVCKSECSITQTAAAIKFHFALLLNSFTAHG